MLHPVLVLGHMGAPALLRHGVGYLDDDQVYDLYARSDPFMPAGVGGEAAFFTIYLTTTHYSDGTILRVTPRIDGQPLDSTTVALNTANTEGVQRVTEIDLSQSHVVGGVEKLRYAPRGTWMDVTVESLRGSGSGVGDRQVVDGIEVEFEIVQEGKQPVAGL